MGWLLPPVGATQGPIPPGLHATVVHSLNENFFFPLKMVHTVLFAELFAPKMFSFRKQRDLGALSWMLPL